MAINLGQTLFSGHTRSPALAQFRSGNSNSAEASSLGGEVRFQREMIQISAPSIHRADGNP
jgi:hypothetical protein